MRYWETALDVSDRPAVEVEYARIWQAADEVVCSRTLTSVDTARTELVDEVGLVVHPVVVGGGTPALPAGLRLDLALLEERRLSAGVVHLRYRVRR